MKELRFINKVLPRMTTGDWIFWSIVVSVGIFLLWLWLIEQFVPLWVGGIVAAVLGIVTFKYGPRVEE